VVHGKGLAPASAVGSASNALSLLPSKVLSVVPVGRRIGFRSYRYNSTEEAGKSDGATAL
jgi:hypothetical protein